MTYIQTITTKNYEVTLVENITGSLQVMFNSNVSDKTIKVLTLDGFTIDKSQIDNFINNGFILNHNMTKVKFVHPKNESVEFNCFSDLKSGICDLLHNYKNKDNKPVIKFVGKRKRI